MCEVRISLGVSRLVLWGERGESRDAAVLHVRDHVFHQRHGKDLFLLTSFSGAKAIGT